MYVALWLGGLTKFFHKNLQAPCRAAASGPKPNGTWPWGKQGLKCSPYSTKKGTECSSHKKHLQGVLELGRGAAMAQGVGLLFYVLCSEGCLFL